jgi:uncharacterized protein YbjT (DUF2867 family)
MVTGAFSFTGRYIAARLLELGREVRTLTRHPQSESPFGARVVAFPLDFEAPEDLAASLRGVDTVYNTYWIRSPRAELTFERALANTAVLLRAAREAGVRRVVQLSVSNASTSSRLPYFRPKAVAEEGLTASGLSYAIVRPTLVFAREDVLVHARPRIALALSAMVGSVMRDRLVTRAELAGLMQGLLTSRGEPTGTRRLPDWLRENADSVGRSYVSERIRNWS